MKRVHAMAEPRTVQYRVRKDKEGLGRSVSRNRLHVELALLTRTSSQPVAWPRGTAARR
jgi:hypothetical protein